MNTGARYSIGVDVGGTKVAAGVLDQNGEQIDYAQYASNKSDTLYMFELIVGVINDLSAKYPVVGACIALPSLVSRDRRYIYTTANLDWQDEYLVDRLKDLVSIPVVLENDANAAGWAEFTYGAARGETDGLMLTIGTGVGGAVILNGEPYAGGFGTAGEPGHMRFVPDGRECGCGARGCFEQYASGSALTRAALELAASHDPVGAGLAAALTSQGKLTGAAIHDLYAAGDPGAVQVVTMIGERVGEGIASIGALLDPAVVVIGGGVSSNGEGFREAIVTGYRRSLPAAGFRPEADIRLAKMGNAAGWIGAADLAQRKLGGAIPRESR